MPTKGQGAPAGDAFELRDDGTVYLRWDDTEVTLRRPKAKEFGSLLEEMEACDAWLVAETRTAIALAGPENPYRGLYARIIEELGATTVAREELPIWMLDGKLVVQLNRHWLALPLPPSAQA